MEFKGTKGEWVLMQNASGYYTSVRNLHDTRKICVSRVNSMIESNANLLLISKAPQMLAMLEKVKMYYGDPVEYISELKQLIKEATDI